MGFWLDPVEVLLLFLCAAASCLAGQTSQKASPLRAAAATPQSEHRPCWGNRLPSMTSGKSSLQGKRNGTHGTEALHKTEKALSRQRIHRTGWDLAPAGLDEGFSNQKSSPAPEQPALRGHRSLPPERLGSPPQEDAAHACAEQGTALHIRWLKPLPSVRKKPPRLRVPLVAAGQT